MRVLLLFIGISHLFSSCAVSNEEERIFVEPIEELDFAVGSNRSPVFLLMHVNDCSPCIDTVIDFVKTNFKKEEIAFVVSSSSSKLVRITRNDYKLSGFNIIPDSKDSIKRRGIVKGGLPVFVFFHKDGQMERFELGPGERPLTAELLELYSKIRKEKSGQ